MSKYMTLSDFFSPDEKLDFLKKKGYQIYDLELKDISPTYHNKSNINPVREKLALKKGEIKNVKDLRKTKPSSYFDGYKINEVFDKELRKSIVNGFI